MRLLVSFLLVLVLAPAALANGAAPAALANGAAPAALAAGPSAQTISGTISGNSGAAITITSGTRSVTCLVVGAKAQAALVRWGIGARASMACKQSGDHLFLTRLSRLGSKETTGDPPVTTRTTDDHGTTAPTPAPTPTTTTTSTHRDAHGKVTALGAGTITVTRGDGSTLTCSVTDGQAHSIAAGAPVGTAVQLTCAGDGSLPALVNLQRIDTSTPPPAPTPPPTTTHSTTTTPPPPTTIPDRRYASGIVTSLTTDGVTVKPDGSGDSLHCRITAAPDSAAAAAKLSSGAHVAIGCRRDGDSWVLAGASPVS
jgi:hypothetical protein